MGHRCDTTIERVHTLSPHTLAPMRMTKNLNVLSEGMQDRRLANFGLTLRIAEQTNSATIFLPDPGVEPGAPSAAVALRSTPPRQSMIGYRYYEELANLQEYGSKKLSKLHKIYQLQNARQINLQHF